LYCVAQINDDDDDDGDDLLSLLTFSLAAYHVSYGIMYSSMFVITFAPDKVCCEVSSSGPTAGGVLCASCWFDAAGSCCYDAVKECLSMSVLCVIDIQRIYNTLLLYDRYIPLPTANIVIITGVLFIRYV